MPDTVGFIGLGVMGKPMAKHVQAKGYPLVVASRSRPPVDELVALGARAGASPADVARSSTIVITMLPDTPDVERVLEGPDGVIDGLQRGAIVIDMSSISPVATRRLAAKVAAAGGTMLDAPVSGGEIGAINAQLSIMVGGDAAAFAKARPVLACMGHPERIVHVGAEPGVGPDLQGLQSDGDRRRAGRRERSVRARAQGRRRPGAGTAGAARRFRRRAACSKSTASACSRRTTSRASGRSCTRRICASPNETAASLAVAVPATALVSQLINALVASGGGDLDYSAMGTVLFDLAGLE